MGIYMSGGPITWAELTDQEQYRYIEHARYLIEFFYVPNLDREALAKRIFFAYSNQKNQVEKSS
jgi:hypothetical protein